MYGEFDSQCWGVRLPMLGVMVDETLRCCASKEYRTLLANDAMIYTLQLEAPRPLLIATTWIDSISKARRVQ